MAGIFHRKILLMIAHHRDQHFFRQGQKLRIEPAQNHGRKFRQVHHRIEQRLVFPPPRSGNRARSRIESLANLLLALCASQNLGCAQSIHIRRPRPRNRHAALGQNSVPARNVSCPDAVKLQRNRLLVEHRHQPPHRTHKTFIRLAPVHILRPVDRGDFLGQILRENLGGAPAFLGNFRGQVLALRRGDPLQLRNVDSSLLGKRMRRRRRLTILICNVHRRPGHLLGNIRLSHGNAGRPSPPTAEAYRNKRSPPQSAVPGSAARRHARATPARPRQSSALESLRTRSQAGSLACLQTIKFLKRRFRRM